MFKTNHNWQQLVLNEYHCDYVAAAQQCFYSHLGAAEAI